MRACRPYWLGGGYDRLATGPSLQSTLGVSRAHMGAAAKAGSREPEPEDKPLIDLLGSQAGCRFLLLGNEWL